MKNHKALIAFLIIFTLSLASTSFAKAQQPAENMTTFFDYDFPGINVQVNATTETQPNQNITVILTLKQKPDVNSINIKHFNMSIFGFQFGKDKILLNSTTGDNFFLNITSPSEYTCILNVPENIWDATYGEILLTYSATYGIVTLNYEKLSSGFTMTHVENVYLKQIEETLKRLNDTFWQSFQKNLTEENLALLNKTYWEQQASMNDLDNTRRVVAVLVITTIFFVATTLYMVIQKPKQNW